MAAADELGRRQRRLWRSSAPRPQSALARLNAPCWRCSCGWPCRWRRSCSSRRVAIRWPAAGVVVLIVVHYLVGLVVETCDVRPTRLATARIPPAIASRPRPPAYRAIAVCLDPTKPSRRRSPHTSSMASAILHIKDAYYFEVPRALWKSERRRARNSPSTTCGSIRLPGLGSAAAVRRAGQDRRPRRTCRPRTRCSTSTTPGGTSTPTSPSRSTAFSKKRPARRGSSGNWPWASSTKQQRGEDRSSVGWPAKQGARLLGDAMGRGESRGRGPRRRTRKSRRLAGREDRRVQPPARRQDPHSAALGGKLRNNYEQESGFAISKFMILGAGRRRRLLIAGLQGAGQADQRRPAGARAGSGTCSRRSCCSSATTSPSRRSAHHDADRFVPLLWTIFMFVLWLNLLGMLPWVGAPTASFSVTLALAAGDVRDGA